MGAADVGSRAHKILQGPDSVIKSMVHYSMNQSVNQSINQSINQSVQSKVKLSLSTP
jgi:hypothetical protein